MLGDDYSAEMTFRAEKRLSIGGGDVGNRHDSTTFSEENDFGYTTPVVPQHVSNRQANFKLLFPQVHTSLRILALIPSNSRTEVRWWSSHTLHQGILWMCMWLSMTGNVISAVTPSKGYGGTVAGSFIGAIVNLVYICSWFTLASFFAKNFSFFLGRMEVFGAAGPKVVAVVRRRVNIFLTFSWSLSFAWAFWEKYLVWKGVHEEWESKGADMTFFFYCWFIPFSLTFLLRLNMTFVTSLVVGLMVHSHRVDVDHFMSTSLMSSQAPRGDLSEMMNFVQEHHKLREQLRSACIALEYVVGVYSFISSLETLVLILCIALRFLTVHEFILACSDLLVQLLNLLLVVASCSAATGHHSRCLWWVQRELTKFASAGSGAGISSSSSFTIALTYMNQAPSSFVVFGLAIKKSSIVKIVYIMVSLVTVRVISSVSGGGL
jgi:hypothetical protein